MPISRWIQRLAVLCLLMLGVARTQAGIVNGDFELGPDAGAATGWSDSDTHYGYSRCSIQSCPNGRSNYMSSGDYWIWFGGAPQEQDARLQQMAVIEAGTTTLSFDFWAWSTQDQVSLWLTIDDTLVWITPGSNASKYASGYSTQNVLVSRWADGNQHKLLWSYHDYADGGFETSWFLDNVRLDTPPAGNLPEPGTLMLSGMAGLALVATRRRQGLLS